ncbi:MAG TPA: NosD domain-containing protein [Chloroflexota bacterium]|nr:NosD domain-containing protein [Chloroflexota bacterium]
MKRLALAAILLIACGAPTPTPIPPSPTTALPAATPTTAAPAASTVPTPTTAPAPAAALAATVAPTAPPAPAATPSPSPGRPALDTPRPTEAAPKPAEAKPPSRTVQCGETVRESISLGADMKCPGDAIVVGASGITIDLGGKKITGPGTGSPTWPRPNLQSVGIKVGGQEAVTIRNGFVESFSSGILLDGANVAVVEEIDSRENYYGIYLKGGRANNVRQSKFISNVYGVTLFESHGNIIRDNEASRSRHLSPGGYGLYLYGSDKNTFFGNTFDSNVNWGLWLSSSKGNVFYRNNIVNNNPQVSDDTGGNTWHNPGTREGNYWADWEGQELAGTGLGNHPYRIWGPGGATDPFPFVRKNGWLEPNRRPATAAPAPATPTRTASALGPWLAAGDELVAVSPDGGSVVARAPLGQRASNLAWSPDGTTVYAVDAAPPVVALTRPGLLSVARGPALIAVDARTGAVKRAEPLPTLPARDPHVVADRDGQHVHVLDGQSIASFDLKASGWKVPLGYPAAVVDAFASWKHQLLLVANARTRGVDVVWIGGRRISYTIPLAGQPVALAANRAGTRLYAPVAGQEAIPVVETEQYAVVDRLRPLGPGRPIRSVATAPDGTRLYALDEDGTVIARDLAADRTLWTWKLGDRATHLAAHPDGTRLFVATGTTLTTLATADGSPQSILRLPTPIAAILASP